MMELERALVIGRASYERWLGTEPHEIDAAASALYALDPQHPAFLQIRARQSRRIKRLLNARL